MILKAELARGDGGAEMVKVPASHSDAGKPPEGVARRMKR